MCRAVMMPQCECGAPNLDMFVLPPTLCFLVDSLCFLVYSAFQTLKTLQGHVGLVMAVAVSQDGQTIVSGGQDTSLRVWNAITGQVNLFCWFFIIVCEHSVCRFCKFCKVILVTFGPLRCRWTAARLSLAVMTRLCASGA